MLTWYINTVRFGEADTRIIFNIYLCLRAEGSTLEDTFLRNVRKKRPVTRRHVPEIWTLKTVVFFEGRTEDEVFWKPNDAGRVSAQNGRLT